MQNTKVLKDKTCIKFIQVNKICTELLSLFLCTVLLGEANALFAATTVNTTNTTSATINTTPNNDTTPPNSEENWTSSLFAPDDGDVLKNMAKQVQAWEEKEEYVRVWNLQVIEKDSLLDHEEKVQFLKKNALKYLDRRLAQKLKEAKKDSTVYKISRVQQNLTPSAEVAVANNFNMKFKARLLEGRATLLLVNPYIDWYINFSARSNEMLDVYVGREISSVGVKTDVNYNSARDELTTTINKKITDTVASRVSLAQKLGANNSLPPRDQKIELIYQRPF